MHALTSSVPVATTMMVYNTTLNRTTTMGCASPPSNRAKLENATPLFFHGFILPLKVLVTTTAPPLHEAVDTYPPRRKNTRQKPPLRFFHIEVYKFRPLPTSNHQLYSSHTPVFILPPPLEMSFIPSTQDMRERSTRMLHAVYVV